MKSTQSIVTVRAQTRAAPRDPKSLQRMGESDRSAMVHFITQALRLWREKKGADTYLQLTRRLQQASARSSNAQLLYQALADCVTEVDVTRCSELFVAILSFDWCLADAASVDAYQNFLLKLVSANRDALKGVLHMLLEQLKAVISTVPDERGSFLSRFPRRSSPRWQRENATRVAARSEHISASAVE
jgi:hypothetical protein